MAAACLEHAEGVLHRLQTQFGDRFTDAQATLAADLARARMNYEAAYGIPLERPQ
jgi:hypothetical protein